ncbi:Regulator of chromosome condensation (RCC1) repeat [Leishmania donovani]|uniref:Regulator_of_chromosome_condensation_(RCC1)_repea t_putative/Pfam:PF00415/Pfam:PF13540 n=1 Tax=Leishmania donovani TaxID=5661 RepID=A0A6J8F7L0_LEIDO|nr:Regulator of chromosome condensation (RCC1) repeat [Leishmania donovani]VDZ43696.1 Regulator_of_chromosome_condensation_(RCC1)_repeat_putative/Pfam:PF00415/Pfam:PF13540 [Leishmania donovani]
MRHTTSSGCFYRFAATASSPPPQLPARWLRQPEASSTGWPLQPHDQRQQQTATTRSPTQACDSTSTAAVASRHARPAPASPSPRSDGDIAAAATGTAASGRSCASPLPRRSHTAAEERLSAPSAALPRSFYFQPVRTTESVCVATTASSSEWVLLNVGGRLITTTVGTLMADPDSVLASLCACLVPPPGRGDIAAGKKSGARRSAAMTTQEASGRCGAVADATPPGEEAPEGGVRCDPLGRDNRTHTANLAEGRNADGLRNSAAESGGGDAQTLPPSAASDAEVSPAAEDGPQHAPQHDNDSAQLDGDRSSLFSEIYTCHRPLHHSIASTASTSAAPPPALQRVPHQHSLLSVMRESRPDYVAAHTPPAVSLPVGASVGEGGDGEAVSPQQTASAIPLDTDGANAILLDLDADYFLPILNYLRHGAVMIPHYLSVAGVLAMAEYLNVMGLVRLLRGPPKPRRVMLFSWGSGGNGELGTHATRDEPTPTMAQVTPFGVRVCEIALGANYSCALSDTGSIYTFGNGEWGQLGLGGSGCAVRGGSSPPGGGVGGGNGTGQDGVDVPVELLIPRRIPLFEQLPAVHVAAGYAFAMAIVEGHHVYFWGNNNHGQSGRGRAHFDLPTKKVDAPVLVDTLEGKRIIQLSCGSFFALALSDDGFLYSWGLVDCVGLGTPEEVERRYRDVLGESLSNERRAVVLTPQLVTVKGRRRVAPGGAAVTAPERIVRIRAGQWHSGAINEHGELFTWGVGYQGRLGHGSKAPAYVPTLVRGALEGHRVVDVACGSFHTVALTAAGAVFCWGDNASGQCGTTAGSPDAFTAPYRVVGLEYVAGGVARSIACGRQHTVVVMEGPQPWCPQPCCRADAAESGCHSHAQVYCFGEATRTANATGSTASAVAAAAVSGATRGTVSSSHIGVSVAAMNAGALPASPGHGPYMTGGAAGGYQPALAPGGAAAAFPTRSPLPCTGGHHHPHYQLVPGLQNVDVRGVVSGLHHTFAYVEELCADALRVADGFGETLPTATRGWEHRPSYPPYPPPLLPPQAASAAESHVSHSAFTWGSRGCSSGGTNISWARSFMPPTPASQRPPSAYRDPWTDAPVESSTDSVGGRIMPLTRTRTMHPTSWSSDRVTTPFTGAASSQQHHRLASPLTGREEGAYLEMSRGNGDNGRLAGSADAV